MANNFHDIGGILVAGVDMHVALLLPGLIPPPFIPTFVPRMPHLVLLHPYSMGGNQKSTVLFNGRNTVVHWHTSRRLWPHLNLPPFPINLLIPLHILFGQHIAWLPRGTVEIEGETATCTNIAGPLSTDLDCWEFGNMPSSLVFQPSTVQTSPTLADYAAGVQSFAIDLAFNLAFHFVSGAISGVIMRGVRFAARAIAAAIRNGSGAIANAARRIANAARGAFPTPRRAPRPGSAPWAAAQQGSGNYPGVDSFTGTNLNPGDRIYGLVNDASSPQAVSPFFASQNAIDEIAGNPNSGDALYEGLQVAPNQQHGVRPALQEFVVVEPTPAAVGTAAANPQWGGGGLEQIVAPPSAVRPVGDPTPLQFGTGFGSTSQDRIWEFGAGLTP
jgi:hypothetical protein